MESAAAQAQAILEAYLAEKGLRRTEERTEVLKAIYEELTHFDAESLHKHLQEKGLRVSRATVYNTLDLLVACGLVTRYHFGEGRTLYERTLGRRQHDHLICLDCNLIREFCAPQMGPVIDGVARLFQVKPVQHQLVIYAHCADAACPHRSSEQAIGR